MRFDMQLMQDAEVSGIEYQQGELQGYEVREYLLEKFGRRCCYCGAKNVPFEIEHIMPKSRGGSNRVSNLCLACHDCNEAKGNQTATEFGYPNIQSQAKKPLKDASAVNTVRWAMFGMFKSTAPKGFPPVEVGTGDRTKFNRSQQDYPKAHWHPEGSRAACVGASGQVVELDSKHQPLLIKAMGRGSRQMCRMDRYGFPRTSAKAAKRVYGFQTGDMVRAIVPNGKKKGTYNGRVAVRSKGSFNITTTAGTVQGIGWKNCRQLWRIDGYSYDLLPSTAG